MMSLESKSRPATDTHRATVPVPEAVDHPKPKAPSKLSWRALVAFGVVLVVTVAAFALGAIPKLRQHRALEAASVEAAAAAPRVSVALARRAAEQTERVLPGNAQPLMEAAMFARATGYIKSRLVDIGDRVEQGQLLAAIDAPDIDDQLAQAKANLEQAKATLKQNEANAVLARTILARSLKITDKGAGVITQEEIDREQATVGTTAASVENARASIQVNEAAVQRFSDLQAFTRIVAPFPGVVTARHIDQGDLVSADSTNRELFHLMRTDVLRVFVNVPQIFATDIKVGQNSAIFRREDAKTTYAGKVTRTADALDTNTRTLLVEVQVPNPKNDLRPGMYLQVKFLIDQQNVPVMVPAAALASGANGSRIGVLNAEQKVEYRDVRLGRDYGAEVEVLAGVAAGEQVVIHPGDNLPAGQTVVPVPRN